MWKNGTGEEAPKALQTERRGGGEMARGYPPPHPTGESEERRELPSGVQGGAPAENVFGTFYLP